MDDVTNTGVTTEGGAPSAAETPVVPQTASVEADSQAQPTDTGAAPPATDQTIPENDDDLASLSETERTPLINQRNRIRELNKWRTEVEPITSWVEERGGMDYIRSDVDLVDKLHSPNVEDRQQAYASLAGDEAAFNRVFQDFVSDERVQRAALQNMDPQDVLRYVQDAGLLPEDFDTAAVADIPNELQKVWNTLPGAVRHEYSRMTPEVRNWNLRRDAQLHGIQQAERDRGIQQRETAIHEQKSKVYNDVRSIIQQSLASVFPNNEQAMNFVLSATETALYQSPEGVALWNELESLIEGGATRGVREKLPLLIAKAKAVATQQATWLNERESKARQFDELMRLASQDEILAYVNKVRGGMRQPGPGTTPAPTNGHIPKPELRGQYDPANIISYGR